MNTACNIEIKSKSKTSLNFYAVTIQIFTLWLDNMDKIYNLRCTCTIMNKTTITTLTNFKCPDIQ